jgi:hypothetical protein
MPVIITLGISWLYISLYRPICDGNWWHHFLKRNALFWRHYLQSPYTSTSHNVIIPPLKLCLTTRWRPTTGLSHNLSSLCPCTRIFIAYRTGGTNTARGRISGNVDSKVGQPRPWNGIDFHGLFTTPWYPKPPLELDGFGIDCHF